MRDLRDFVEGTIAAIVFTAYMFVRRKPLDKY